MRLVFLGTPDAAVPSLRALIAAGHDVDLVLTRPDRRRGRGGDLSHTSVQLAAEDLGLSVAHSLSDLAGVEVERGVVVAYGALIPADVLARVPMLNVHFSLLPRWRGAAPVERAILAGDEETGVSVMSLEPELDTGPVHVQRRLDVHERTASELTRELAVLGADALVEVLATPDLLNHPVTQHGEVTYAAKLLAETYHLEPEMSSDTFLRVVRLERAFTIIGGRRLRISRAHATDQPDAPAGTVVTLGNDIALALTHGVMALDEVQPEGARLMTGAEWWHGARLTAATARWA
ncbi:MAG TPA: methionyl-tRNA formyltransferase [Acidimicrobiales bacterium]|nr:methionyl-tRNA formyltransferase [Acidimicrobiales bacterium]